MTATLNSYPVESLTLTVPRVGAWVADVALVDAPALAGSVSLVVDGRTWRGVVHRGGVDLGRWTGRLVAGAAGGLHAILGPAAYADTTLAVVLGETLRDAGEALASTSGELTATVARWARVAGPAHHTVADVARAAGYAWRVLDDGSVWCGPEGWAALALGADLDVLSHDPATGRYELAGDACAAIDPGRVVTLDGAAVRVGAVERRQHGAELLTVLYADREGDAGSRLTAAFDGMVKRATRRLDYLAVYPGRVVEQRADGTLDVVADSPDVQLPRAIRYRTLPGLALEVPAGTRVAVGFEGGDPARPFAGLWELGDVTRWTLDGGTHRAAREGNSVTRTAGMQAWMEAVSSALSILTVPSVVGTISEGSDALRLP